MTESFPRQHARTRRFTLGAPRSFRISPDGDRVAFLRSKAGDDPVTCLWLLDVAAGREHLLADPAVLGELDAELPAQESARRERAREQAGGVVTYATDDSLNVAAFALGGHAYLARLTPGAAVQRLPCRTPAFDPRPDPHGRRVAYVCERALRVADLASGEDTELIGPGGAPDVSYGLAEFIAAEEMHRMRGFWWAPDGNALLVARVDESPVQRWHISDPANPGRPSVAVAYPSAGTPNADVSLLLVGLDGSTHELDWDRAGFPYLVTVDWGRDVPLIVVQSRDQRTMRLISADPAHGALAVLREERDEHWVDIVPGVPARTASGRIVWTSDIEGARRLLVATPEELADGSAQPVTPPTLHVRDIIDSDGEVVLFTASQEEPTEIGLWCASAEGVRPVATDPGVHSGRRAGGTTVVASSSLARDGEVVTVLRQASEAPGGASEVAHIASLAERPNLPQPRPDLFSAGEREIRTALLLPSWHQPGSAKLPVLLDPYGGPHAQRVLATRRAFWTSQWFAEQGFAVVVADGRGTPGRGPGWERAVAGDLADPVLEDQLTALWAAADRCADLDLGRVAIRGWSFGGYLSALAVLRRPDVFHAAIVGAPVTDQRLYDTHYTERYLGHPDEHPQAYAHCSPLADAERMAAQAAAGPAAESADAGPGRVHRPMLIIHGLVDDNVVVAHSLRLSAALLAAGYPHSVLPLSGVTHMTPQETVAENLLLLQVDFLRRGLPGGAGPAPSPMV
jgi:dipeptidyl-peptidase-4